MLSCVSFCPVKQLLIAGKATKTDFPTCPWTLQGWGSLISSQPRIPSQNPSNPNLCQFKAIFPCPATPSLAKSHPPSHLEMLFGKLFSYLCVFLPGLWFLTSGVYADYCYYYYYFFTHSSLQFPPWKLHSAHKITIKAIYNIPLTIRWQEYK